MEIIATGTFKVQDGETVSFDPRSTGAQTLFGVTCAQDGNTVPVVEGQPIRIRFDKSQATGASFIPNAKSTNVVLGFSFTSVSGGRYDVTITGDAGGTATSFANQVGNTMQSIVFVFHIV